MTTARGLLRRLLSRGRIDPTAAAGGKAEPGPATQERLEAARRRLKETIPPPEGVSPEEGPSPGARSRND